MPYTLHRRLTAVTADLRVRQLSQLAAELTSIDTGYRDVQPCIQALLDRVAHVNSTVLELPASVTVRDLAPRY